MKRNGARAFLILVMLLALLVGGRAGADDGFIAGVEDLPLMPGLSEIAEAGMVFDKPSGRIVEAFAEGPVSRQAVAEFYDKNIGPAQLVIEAHESFPSASPYEAAHILTLHTTLPNGVVSHVRGVFTYRTDENGLLTNLRGYWHMGVMRFEQPGEA